MEEAAHLGSEPKKSTFEVRGRQPLSTQFPPIRSSPSLIAFLFLADPTVEPSDNMSVIGGTPVWITLGLRDGKGPQRVIYYESSSLCSKSG